MIVSSRLWGWANRRMRVQMPAGGRSRSSSIQLEPKFRLTGKPRLAAYPKQHPTNRFKLPRPQHRNHSSGCRDRQVVKGGGYGVLVDIILGILGGVVGGWVLRLENKMENILCRLRAMNPG